MKLDGAVPLTASPKGIVFVVDTSGSMRQEGKLESVKAAISGFASQKQRDDQIAIVSFNNSAEVIQGLTPDGAKVASSVNRLVANNETAMWDGVNTALQLLAQSPPDLQPNVVIITDGRDTVSSASSAHVCRPPAAIATALLRPVTLTGADRSKSVPSPS